MTTDSELLRPRALHVRVAKKLTLPRRFKKIDLFLTVGDENERYYQHYGVGKDKFQRVPFSIDSSYYDKFLEDPAAVSRQGTGAGWESHPMRW